MSEIDKIINGTCNFQSIPQGSYVKQCSEIVNGQLVMSKAGRGVSMDEKKSINEALLSINVFDLFRPSWVILQNSSQFPHY
ncbi:hypothetical protein MOO05_00400 [Escherichia coli]|jgi:hypothetical protein|uniref:hypothetical protein n=1 Tax=Escherichia coli TaxID=562 RepID=UPI000B33C1CB|nr:hypothetical protein [Escherichia coli]EGI4372550.1 hypothetical protein [Escherichia coli]EHC2891489.1 hypothetical protein [Escherichia coli]EHV2530119.1 hypothetical protein [Escherichia coli]EKR6312938.1 hypothetical protein [Escherichia coli]EKR6937970.1 hypothetical protein [Escherichia coli]